MFDTHCHLNLDEFEERQRIVINGARDAGVKYFVIPGTNIKTSKKAVETAGLYENVYAAVGIHPTENLDEESLEKNILKIKELAYEPNVVAIGETGLDYYRFETPTRIQKIYFKEHVILSLKMNKTLIIHSRQASEDVLKVLNEAWSDSLQERIVFHCMEVSKELLEFALDKKIFIGVDGDITYDTKKQEFIKEISLERLVVETDSPFLTPEPIKKEKSFPNEPKNLVYIIQKIASLKGEDPEVITRETTINAKLLFGIE